MRSVALLTSSFWLLLFISSCHNNEPCTTCPPSGPDTTSHSFNFTQYTFGGTGGSSNFNDVAILADTLVIAVGEVYLTDSTGQVDDQPYSIAKWNGTAWSLERLYDLQNNLIPNVRGVLALSASDIWLADGGVYHWNGVFPQVDKSFDRISLIGGVENGQSINRVWGLTSKDIFGVGYAGMVAHYDGFTWTKLESGTTLDINDIWGATDPSTGEEQILGIASRLDVNEGNRLLQITRTTVTALADSGLPWSLNGIWFVPQEKYYIVGDGIYDADSATPSVWSGGANQVTTYYTTRIRANALNDILVVGAFGEVLHYNGASWKSYRSSQTALDGSYAGVAIKGNLAIAVGSSSSQAIIAMGKRNN